MRKALEKYAKTLKKYTKNALKTLEKYAKKHSKTFKNMVKVCRKSGIFL
jgi:ribosomal protein S17E